ncbi:MAG: sulfur carrier protein ThiS [Acidobacteriia bacterium]|nr:sulfur carrier protein ThiS [Terriglobia bacterium]
MSIEISVNGDARQVPAGSTIETLLQLLRIPQDRVAVELDRRIVRKPEWASAHLSNGAKLEIVHFVGGG